MNATTALCKAFLEGRVLTIKTAFRDFGITNLPRECGRLIERKFGVELVRVPRSGKSRYGVPVTWYEYRLADTGYNKEGRGKMMAYVKEQEEAYSKNDTKPRKKPPLQQLSMFDPADNQ